MKLDGEQFDQLHQALISALPSVPALARVVRTGLNENLASIAGGNDLSETSFNLVVWAESNGRLQELVESAQRANPGNHDLQRFVDEFSRLSQAANTSNSNKPPNRTQSDVPKTMDRSQFIQALYNLTNDDFETLLLNIEGAGRRVAPNANVQRRANELIGWAESATGPGWETVYKKAQEVGLFPM